MRTATTTRQAPWRPAGGGGSPRIISTDATARTKRGAARYPWSATANVLICGASFAGLAIARELAGSGATF